jgi:hypothetical protein
MRNPTCSNPPNINELGTDKVSQINNLTRLFHSLIPGECMFKNDTLLDGYNYYQVYQVYTGFFTHRQLCLFSLGDHVEKDRQFLLFILSYFFGFSKELMEYIKKDNETVYNNLLKIATLYIKTYAPRRAYKGIFVNQKQPDISALTDGSFESVLNYDIAGNVMLGFYSSILKGFQSCMEDSLLNTYKPQNITSKNISSQISEKTNGIINSIIGNTTLDLTSTDSTTKLTNIYNYKTTVFNAFNNLLNIFNTENSNNITNIISNRENKDYLENLATTQFNIEFLLNRTTQRSYNSYSDVVIDIFTNGNIETSILFFCKINAICFIAVQNILGPLILDISTNISDYVNNDGTFKSTIFNRETITLKNTIISLIRYIVDLYKNYYSKLIDYMNYLNNYILGIQLTGAKTTTIIELLSLPSNSNIDVIRDNIYIKLIQQVQTMCNTSVLVGGIETGKISTDPFELYDFPHDFNSFTKSLENKLDLLRNMFSEDFYNNYFDNLKGFNNNTTNTGTKDTPKQTASNVGNMYKISDDITSKQGFSNFRKISKSKFGVDSLTTSVNDSKYSYNLSLLLTKLYGNSPDVASIRTLVNETNNLSVSSKYDYSSIISNINTKIGNLNANNNTLAIELLRTTIPASTAGTAGTTGTTGTNNLTMYLIPLVVLIGLIILFYLMSKKNK